ncbi:MAG TPA: hypothetical protein VFR33_14145 [Candidatus Dormibacteraeota bacterium]|nr:hypothetical protein [Candidatus Dormibacteraeota bacterium]
MSNQGVPAFACGAVAFVAAGVGKQGFSVAHMYPLLFSGLLALEIFLVIKGLTTRGWKLALLGLAMTIGALWVALVPIPSFSS